MTLDFWFTGVYSEQSLTVCFDAAPPTRVGSKGWQQMKHECALRDQSVPLPGTPAFWPHKLCSLASPLWSIRPPRELDSLPHANSWFRLTYSSRHTHLTLWFEWSMVNGSHLSIFLAPRSYSFCSHRQASKKCIFLKLRNKHRRVFPSLAAKGV